MNIADMRLSTLSFVPSKAATSLLPRSSYLAQLFVVFPQKCTPSAIALIFWRAFFNNVLDVRDGAGGGDHLSQNG
ncbi:MAG: hypothetical protein ACLU37_02660 [Collinsella sp.]